MSATDAAPSAGDRSADRGRRRASLAVVLALSVGLLVAGSTGLVGLVLAGANARNTLDLLTESGERIVDRMEGLVRGHLDPAIDQLEFLAGLLDSGAIQARDTGALGLALATSMAATPQVTAVLYYDIVPRFDEPSRLLAFQGPNRVITFEERRVADDPEAARTGIAESAARADPHWGDLVYVPELSRTVLNARLRVVGADDRVDGVLVSSVTVSELSRFLAGIDDTRHEIVPFVLHGRDDVLAHPALADRTLLGNLSQDDPVPPLGAVGDPWLTRLWSAERDADFQSQAVEVRVQLEDGSGRVYLTREITGYAEEPLIIGVHMDVRGASAELDRLTESIVIALVLLGISVVLAVLLARTITGPIGRLSDQASRIASLDGVSIQALPRSHFGEIDRQVVAFNAMVRALRWLETYVPRRLVRRLMELDTSGDDRPAALPSEERPMTVLFTDVEGFTQLSERWPARRTAEFLNDHFALLGAAVEAEGGTIDKFIGDSLMAFWGAPDRQTDHAVRACRAALSMARAIAEDNRARVSRGDPPDRVRVGIHTGTMVVGDIGAPGRMNYTIVGDPVNTGSRLEHLGHAVAERARADARARPDAQPDADVVILASGAVIADLESTGALDARIEALGAHRLRGREAPIEVFRLRPHPTTSEGG